MLFRYSLCFLAQSVLALLVHRSSALLLRDHTRRDGVSTESCSKLTNQDTHYTVEVGVGTPPQKFDLVADTGSNAVIVRSCECSELTSQCRSTEKCFAGNKSSTDVPPSPFAPLVMLSFGSGSVIAAPSTDVVHVGQVQGTMKMGLLLMVKRLFITDYDFEGILGFGVPPWADETKKSNGPTFGDDKLKAGDRVAPPNFLEIASVSMFSMCFKPGQGGALRLNQPAMPNMLKQVGRKHWTLRLNGFSAGSSSTPITVCNPSLAKDGADAPCAAIPDSGTTHIMGPKIDVEQIKADVCAQWPRCTKFKEDSETELSLAEAFHHVLWDCKGWMTPEKGISEVPSLFIHLAGADGAAEVLEITAMSYVYTTKSMTGYVVCAASLETWEMQTKRHGNAWIFGGPLFYEYQVGYGMRPPTIGFEKSSCNLCEGETVSLVLKDGLNRSAAHFPRSMNGKPRMPSIDVHEEL